MDSKAAPEEKAPTFIEAARRAQIVAAAIETIAEVGYAQASLARIAERIGASKGVILYHFSGKEALEQAVIADVLAKAVAYMQPRVSAESTGRGVLRTAILSNLAFMGENRNAMVAFYEIAVHTGRARGSQNPAVASILQQGVSAWTELLSSFQKKGEFRADFDPAVMAAAVRAAIDSVPPRMARDPHFDVEHFGRELADLFDAATRKPGSRRKGPAQ
jgi:TetR/AcrR family transcriptional regulator, fatty acid metabolism regulator protein